MDPENDQTMAAAGDARAAGAWRLARRQHWVISGWQLHELGFGADAIRHRLRNGRLHRTPWRGVYAVGHEDLTGCGIWMAALLACGEGAVLSHRSAAELWGLLPDGQGRGGVGAARGGVGAAGHRIEVTVLEDRRVRRPGIVVHRRGGLGPADIATQERIPVTSPIRTILDLAPRLSSSQLERAINEADKLDLVDPEALRAALSEHAGEPGVAVVRTLLDRLTFVYTDTELERRFLPLARDAGLPPPLTQQWVNGHRVDFYWPDLGLVVETDGLRYHRTPAQQTADRRRDQRHTVAGLTPLRFAHAQVEFDRDEVRATLRRVGRRLANSTSGEGHRDPRVVTAPARRRRAG